MTEPIKTLLTFIVLGLIAGAYFLGRSDGRAREQKAALESAMQQVEKVRAEDRRRLEEQEKIAHETQQKYEQAHAAARAADTAAVRLRERVAVLTARTNDTAAPGQCQAAGSAGILLAELFRRADERAGELAEYADRARIAGQGCEQSYNALTAGARK